jgi:hypothetical protein
LGSARLQDIRNEVGDKLDDACWRLDQLWDRASRLVTPITRNVELCGMALDLRHQVHIADIPPFALGDGW